MIKQILLSTICFVLYIILILLNFPEQSIYHMLATFSLVFLSSIFVVNAAFAKNPSLVLNMRNMYITLLIGFLVSLILGILIVEIPIGNIILRQRVFFIPFFTLLAIFFVRIMILRWNKMDNRVRIVFILGVSVFIIQTIRWMFF